MFRIDQAVDAAFDIRLSLFQLQAAHMQLFSADGKNTADGHEQNFVLIKAARRQEKVFSAVPAKGGAPVRSSPPCKKPPYNGLYTHYMKVFSFYSLHMNPAALLISSGKAPVLLLFSRFPAHSALLP